MTWFVVVSPPVTTGGYDYEPPETGCDLALVEAPTRHAARWAAWKLWKSLKSPWATEVSYGGGTHPLAGVRVVPATPEELEDGGIEAWKPWVARAGVES